MRLWDHLSYGITQYYLPPDRGDFYPNVLPVLIYRPRKDERLSWHQLREWTVYGLVKQNDTMDDWILPASAEAFALSMYYTVFRKITPTQRFLLYLGGKCFDLHKIFRVCLRVIRHFIEVKITYSCYCWLANILSNVYLISWNPLFR